ncbi:polysaccharide deacetylase family protein [Anaerosalibacter sp. Marseille-P3206]|uniref:polysaccharide deacetylase family protein n=1 Tax=Anaerosalibacter sp. Marseille-P3206 TaxID=1871005 RepID=UPI0013563EA3|nr:polysaccharide deacetylase family protein [Anaerosalibacter sp. Marseille-P3206]
MEDYIESINLGRKLQDNSIIITFDDGYKSTYSIALPILNKLELKATVFVPPALLNNNDEGSKNKMMSAKQLKELSKCEFMDIGGHTLNHVDLGKLKYNEAYEEILMGKRTLEELLNKKITTFAYPFGKKCNYNADTIEIVQKSGFSGAVTTNRSKNIDIGKDSIYELNRIGIDNRDTFEIFVTKINRCYPYKTIGYLAKLKNISGV